MIRIIFSAEGMIASCFLLLVSFLACGYGQCD